MVDNTVSQHLVDEKANAVVVLPMASASATNQQLIDSQQTPRLPPAIIDNFKNGSTKYVITKF